MDASSENSMFYENTFDTQILIIESREKVTGNFCIFFMRHRGNIVRYTTNLGVCRNASKLQNRTKTSIQKAINVGAIALTIQHSFNQRVKHEFAPTMKADSGGFEPTT